MTVIFFLIFPIDKEPSVPSVYFIGKDGSPLDIIKGSDELGNLLPRLNNILSKGGILKSGESLMFTQDIT